VQYLHVHVGTGSTVHGRSTCVELYYGTVHVELYYGTPSTGSILLVHVLLDRYDRTTK